MLASVPPPTPVGSSADPLFARALRQVSAAGGQMHPAVSAAANQFLRALRREGVLPRLRCLYLTAQRPLPGDTSQLAARAAASVNLAAPGLFTLTWANWPVAGAFAADGTGVQGDGAVHADTGFIPATHAASAADVLMGAAVRGPLAQNNLIVDVGSGGSAINQIQARGSNFVLGIMGTGTYHTPPAPPDGGLYVSQIANNNVQAYHEGVALTPTTTGLTPALSNRSLYLMARNDAAPNFFSNRRYPLFVIGQALAASQVAALARATRALWRALSITV